MRTPALTLLILSATLGAQSMPQNPSIQALMAEAKAKGEAVMDARRAHIAAGKNTKDFRPNCGPELKRVDARLAQENSPELHQTLLVSRFYYLTLAKETPSAEFLARITKEVPPASPAWSLEPGLLSSIYEEGSPASLAYVAAARQSHPDPEVRKSLLFDYFWEMLDAKKEAEWRPAYESLLKDFADSDQARKAKEILAGELKTAVGKPAPAFAIAALDAPGKTYTLKDFEGSYLLIDFWATWCPPCRAEMPQLHKAWATFKGKKFQILSLSFDRKVEHIAPFRKQAATPMPWSHAFVEGGFTSPLAQAYGVMGIPKPLLIGPDGIIVANGGDVRGEKLLETLRKHLD
ncbi:MAG: Thiol-disulfide isomerase or thioredoxin [Holophagaceae bacterium]|nr:Thiol-disulfide isomerase or thioredoxin [Holophagaceae bacterium]